MLCFKPIRVLVTGAAGQIAYSLVGLIGRGEVFGKDQPIILHLLDIAPAMPVLHGVVMELEDCSFPLLKGIVATSNEEEAFKDIDIALLVGAMPRKEGMERKDLLRANVRIFKQQGDSLDKYAKKSVKILVVGNPANTNCFIASHFAPSIPKENFSALTRLDLNRAKSQIACKLGISCKHVQKCIIWGNHSNTQFPDVSQAVATMPDGNVQSVTQAVKDEQWLKTVFIKCVQTRGAEVIKARKMSSAMSAAKAIGDHMRDWWFGTTEVVSMAVISDGSYGVPKDLVFSFPVTIADRKWTIWAGVTQDDFAKEKMAITTKELLQEKEDALAEVSG